MDDVKHALQFAYDAHLGQFDKAGDPYILHPLRVGLAGTNKLETVCGFLHDVIEDTDIPIGQITQEFGTEVRIIVALLTRDKINETYREFVERSATHPVAKRVKLLDIQDNRFRMYKLDPATRERLDKKYAAAEHYLVAGFWPDRDA